MNRLRERFGAAMIRAAVWAFFALGIGGCEFARTNVPYDPPPGAAGENWAAIRAACARDGSLPVQQYQWAMVTSEAALGCEPPAQMMREAAPGN